MNVICTKCGSTNVGCEAMINPNTKEVHYYVEESFEYGWCDQCGYDNVLTDTDEVKAEIDRKYQEYLTENNVKPEYAVCVVVWKSDGDSEQTNIQLSSDSNPDEDDDMLFYCNGISDLKSLCEFGGEDFIVTEIHSFERFSNK